MGGEPRRLVDATGLDTEPFNLASTQPPEGARGNLSGNINKGRVDAHAHHVAPQKILGLVDFGARGGMYPKRGAIFFNSDGGLVSEAVQYRIDTTPRTG